MISLLSFKGVTSRLTDQALLGLLVHFIWALKRYQRSTPTGVDLIYG